MKIFIPALLLFVLASGPLHAQTLPPAVLDKEYENCMKQATPAVEAQMKSYCQCIRTKMSLWDEQTYVRVAEDTAKSGSSSPLLQQLAKDCLSYTR